MPVRSSLVTSLTPWFGESQAVHMRSYLSQAQHQFCDDCFGPVKQEPEFRSLGQVCRA